MEMKDSNSTISDWTEDLVNALSGGGDLSELSYGAILVVSEMSLTLLSIVFNLIPSYSTLNVILGNLCCSNLLAAVFVKSIAIIYNGYA
ncbi:Uncharacterized protein FKW44_016876, partial [Caligus rogercresseyi]